MPPHDDPPAHTENGTGAGAVFPGATFLGSPAAGGLPGLPGLPGGLPGTAPDRPSGAGAGDGFDMNEVMDTLRTVWTHRDDIIRVATQVPSLLGEAGEFMHHAGQGAQRAAQFLTGDVREIAGTAAHALATSTAQLKNVLTVLDNIGDALAQVPFLDDLGAMITNGLDAITGVANNVESVAQRVLALGDRLGNVGSDLDRVGHSLVGGGQMLADFGGRRVEHIAGFAGLPDIDLAPVKVRPVKRVPITPRPDDTSPS